LATLQPFQRSFQGSSNQRNQRKRFATQQRNTLVFCSVFPTNQSIFFVKTFGLYRRFLKWIFASPLLNSVAPTFSAFLKVRHKSFYDLKRVDCEPD
jgi:hypothetical protein